MHIENSISRGDDSTKVSTSKDINMVGVSRLVIKDTDSIKIIIKINGWEKKI